MNGTRELQIRYGQSWSFLDGWSVSGRNSGVGELEVFESVLLDNLATSEWRGVFVQPMLRGVVTDGKCSMSEEYFDVSNVKWHTFVVVAGNSNEFKFQRLQSSDRCASDTSSRDQSPKCAREPCINMVVSCWYLSVCL